MGSDEYKKAVNNELEKQNEIVKQNELIDFNIQEIKSNIKIPLLFYPNSSLKYLAGKLYMHSKQLEVFSIQSINNNINFQYKGSIKSDNIFSFDFHPKYENLLALPLNNGKIKVYQIKEENSKTNFNLLSNINAFNSTAFNCIFNPNINEIILSCSGNEVKVFDLTAYDYIQSFDFNSSNHILKWKSLYEYAYLDENGIIIRDYRKSNLNDRQTISIEGIVNDFYFIDNYNLITIQNQESSIKLWNIKKANYQLFEIKNDGLIHFTFYDKFARYLYIIFSRGFKIFNLKEFKFIDYSKECLDYLYNPLLLNSELLIDKNHDISNIFYNDKTSKIITIKNKKNYPFYRNYELQEEVPIKFINEIKNYIANFDDIVRLDESPPFEDIEKITQKNYINNKEIQEELNKIKNILIFKRKIKENDINRVENIINIKDKYLGFIKLIIKDDTNKNLMTNYLQFLQRKEKSLKLIKDIFIEDFKDELNYYKVMFNQNELYNRFKEKKKAEKDEIILLLKKIKDALEECIHNKKIVDRIIILRKSFQENNKLKFFNQPISFDNDELFFFKIKANIYENFNNINLYIKNEKEESIPNLEFFKKKVYVIKKILEENYFENRIICKSKDKINLLAYLIIYPENEYITNYILNLLTSYDLNVEEINKIKKK